MVFFLILLYFILYNDFVLNINEYHFLYNYEYNVFVLRMVDNDLILFLNLQYFTSRLILHKHLCLVLNCFHCNRKNMPRIIVDNDLISFLDLWCFGRRLILHKRSYLLLDCLQWMPRIICFLLSQRFLSSSQLPYISICVNCQYNLSLLSVFIHISLDG